MTSPLHALAALTTDLHKPLTLDEMMQIVVARAAELLCTERTSMRLLDASRTRLLAVCRHGRPVHAGRQEEFRVGEGLMGWIAEHGQPICSADAESDPRFEVRPGMQTRLGSFVGVPMMQGERCIGVLSAVHPDLGFFDEDDLVQLTLISGLCAPHVEAARLKRLARLDPLTGAMNRRGFDSQFPEVAADRDGLAEPLSVIMVDIDRFKDVNDTYGHEAGDDVLRSVTGILASAVRETDAVVRYGGEEFLLVLPHATIRGAESIAERARVSIGRAPIASVAGPVQITASLGVAQRRPGESRAELVGRADEAMYRAKRSGRNRVTVAE